MSKNKRSQYKSSKSVAKNKTVPISVDDPRAARNKIGQTRSRQGAEVEIIGLDGVALSSGGIISVGTGRPPGVGPDPITPPDLVVPGPPGLPPYVYGSFVASAITNLSTAWSTESGKTQDLIVTFDWDYNDPDTRGVVEFVLEITTSNGLIRKTPYGSFPANRTQIGQTLTFSESLNRSTLGVPRTNITSVCVYAIDAFFNTSTQVCDTTIPAYVLPLPVPVITVTAAVSGYNVAYTIPTDSIFDAIDIVEYESNASTEPTGVTYSRVYFNSVSPANVITLNNNSRWVKARFTSDVGESTAFCVAQKITPTPAVTVDTTGPTAPTGTVTGGLESSGTIGFNAFLNISWTGVVDSTLRGYRIRFRPVTDPVSNYSYVDSPGAGTSFRITGLASGTTYEVAIAAYDEFNNTSTSYQTLTGSPVSTTGSPFIGTNVSTTGYFEAGVAGTDTGVFRFGYGVATGKRGLSFNTNNYWYIDSAQSALFKLGGDANNYIQWDGENFNVAGNITARGGSFTGNVLLSGGSLYAPGSGGSANSGIRTIFNSSGIAAYNASGGYTAMLTTPLSDGTVFVTNAANIGGWTVNASKISKTQTNEGTISLNSAAGQISVTNDNIANQTSGINSPEDETGIVFWGGAEATAGVSSESQVKSAPFRVDLAGDLYAANAVIQGDIVATTGGFGTKKLTTNEIAKGWEVTVNGIKAINDGTTGGYGSIQLGSHSIQSTNGEDFFVIHEDGTNVINTGTTANLAPTDRKRIFLGDTNRQVEVIKSAGVWPLGATETLPSSDTTVINQYRSGGLRNIFTVTEGNLHQDGTNLNSTSPILDFPSSKKGDILIVWDVNNPSEGGVWRKIVGMYLNADGIIGDVPTSGTVALTGNTTNGSTITATTSGWTNTPTSYFVQIRVGRNGNIPTETTGELVASSTTSSVTGTISGFAGDIYKAFATATNSSGTSVSVGSTTITSTESVTPVTPITPAPSAPTGGSASLTGDTLPGGVIQASTSGWSGSPTSYTLTIRYNTDGTTPNESSSVAATTSSSSLTYSLPSTSLGYRYKAFASATNSAGTSTVVGSETILIAPNQTVQPPTGGTVSLTGNSTFGSLITATTSGWTNTPTSYYVTIRVSRNGNVPTELSELVASSSTNTATFTINESPGAIFKAFATATNSGGTSSSVGSSTITVTSTPAPSPVAPTPVAPTPVSPTPVAPTPVAPVTPVTPVAPSPFFPNFGYSPVAPTPVAPTPVAPTPVAPTPVAPTPVAPTPGYSSLRFKHSLIDVVNTSIENG